MLYIICVTTAIESQEHGEFSRKCTKDRSENCLGKSINKSGDRVSRSFNRQLSS